MATNTVIESFLERYSREYDHYHLAAQLCSQQCESALRSAGVKAIVTFRAKRPESLRVKLYDRVKTKKYGNVDDIYKDIVDLAGVRIALYFPKDRFRVRRIIDKSFSIEDEKPFPEKKKSTGRVRGYKKRFAGYHASHFRVRLREDALSDDSKRFTQPLIEVQVATVLMHAWSEVEHDLVYKPLSGKLSTVELALLDQINGLVMAGEIALERLQVAYKNRIEAPNQPFENHFELAAYLHGSLTDDEETDEPMMGRADVLFRFLNSLDRATPAEVDKILFEMELDNNRPISEQVADSVIAGDSQLYERYAEARIQAGARNPYSTAEAAVKSGVKSALHEFIARWIALESGVEQLNVIFQQPRRFITIKLLREHQILSEGNLERFDLLRALRNHLVHGIEVPDEAMLEEAAKNLSEILSEFVRSAPEDAALRVRATLQRLDVAIEG